jgi:hypothetical protein
LIFFNLCQILPEQIQPLHIAFGITLAITVVGLFQATLRQRNTNMQDLEIQIQVILVNKQLIKAKVKEAGCQWNQPFCLYHWMHLH